MPNLNTQISGSSIAFIDPKVEDYQSLIAGVKPGTEVVILDGKRDAIDQITEILALRSNIDSIHIVSHGAPGSLQLGSGGLSLDNLEAYSEKLRQWRSAFSLGADILIYGCNVALSAKGFIQRIAQLTNTNVAASTNLTGSAAKGGDWKLEVKTGEINTPLVFAEEVLAGYQYVLNSFKPATNFSVSPNYSLRKVATGDFNKDGNLDIAFASTGTGISIALGDGTGNFGTATNVSPTPSWFVAVGDLNGDGNADLTTANYGTNNVSVLLGTGSGTFGTATDFSVGSSPYTVAVGDFNKDGKQDLVTANQSGNNVSVLLNTGSGTFGTATDFSVGSSPYFVAVGDFNKDGISDLATANFGSNNISILLGTGTGSFGIATDFTVGNSPNYIAVADFNGDGNSDLATSNEGSNNVSILLGDGTGNFGAATNFGVGTQPLSIAAGYFDADGKLDLATANNGSGDVSVLFGSGSGTFGAATNFVVGTYPQGIAVGDFNKDGLSDLATANFGSSNVSFLLNTSPVVNFGAATYAGTEGTADTVVNIPVTISNTPDADVTVPIVIDPSSTATQNSDYAFSPTSITFPAGATGAALTQNVAVTIKPDNLPENAETALLNFGTITGGVAGTTKQTTLTIAANDQPLNLTPYQIDLKTGAITGQPNPFISLVNNPTDSNADSWLEAVAKINFDGNIKKAKFIVEYDKAPSGWTVNLGDSESNDGYGGDTGNQSRDAETQIVNGSMAVFGNDYNTPSGGELTQGNVPNFVSDGSRVELEVSNENLAWDNKTGLKNSLNSPYLYALNGQADDGGPVNSEIYAGFNRVISEPGDRIGSGASKVTILLNPIDYAVSAGIATVTEGNSGQTGVTFTVTRSGATEFASKIDYAIAGTATNISDYNNIGGTSGATAATGTINFAAGETSKTITLDVLGDLAIEPNETINVTLSNPSGLDSTPTITTAVATTTLANDDAGVIVNPTGLTTSEVGGKADFTVKLKSQPTADVTFSLSSSNPAEGTVSTNSLTFTPANWDREQKVTVTGVDDLVAVADGNQNYTIITAAGVSTDPLYNNLNPDDVNVSNSDNETPGITVNPTAGLTTGEDGAKANFDVVLNTLPTANVTIGLNSSNVAEGTVSTPSLTFTPANWDTPQQVTVTGVNDSIVDGNIDYKIVTGLAVSDDPNYKLDAADVSLSNQDNDTAGVSISVAETKATEGGANGSYEIKLTSQPIAPVTITLTTGNQIEAIAPITFTADNWQTAQPVTVKAVDDAIVEGAHSGIITHSVTSTDAKYNGIAVAGVIGAIVDNDTAPTPTPTPTTSVTPTPTPPLISVDPQPPTPTPTPTPTTSVTPTPTPTTSVTPTPTPTTSVTPTPTPTTSVTPTPTPTTSVTPTPTPGGAPLPPDSDSPTPTPVTTGTGRTDMFRRVGILISNDLPQSFTEVAYSFTSNELDLKIPGFVGANAWGDYDNDGDLDLLVMEGGSLPDNYYSSFPRSQYTPKVYSNEGGQGFKPIDTTGLPTVYGGVIQENGKNHDSKPSATWGDSDNDGDLDILLTGVRTDPKETNTASYIPITALYVNQKIENNRPPSYQTQETDPKFVLEGRAKLPGIFNGSAAWGDYNNDGRQDLVLTGDTSSGYIAKVFRNERIGFNDGITFSVGISFEEETGASLPGVIGNAAWGDYDNDGQLDILLAGDTGGSKYVANLYRNNGNGFTEESKPLLQNQNNLNQPINYGAWGDSNSDGQLDILLTGTKQGPSFTRVLLNNSNYQETKFEDRLIPSGPNAGFGAWGDEDNDGDLDILLTQTDSGKGVAKVYRNNPNSFEPIDDPTLPNNVQGPTSWGDYDKDGRLDIALTTRDNLDGTFVKVYLNDTPDANTRPSAPQPQFLNTFNTSEGVLLRWRPVDSSTSINGKTLDSKTPDRGLSYNLRVWTTSNPNGSGDVKEYIVGPMSSNDGTRQVVQLGNVNQARDYLYGEYTWLLKPDYLIPGQTYNWSVQAIDSAWAGSPFAQGEFKAPDIKPTLTITATDPNAAEIAPKYPDEPLNSGKFTITRTGGNLAKPLDVYYKVDNRLDNISYTPIPDTAIPGIDYQLLSESGNFLQSNESGNFITIPADKRSINMVVKVNDDNLVEGDEKVFITLDSDYSQKVGEPSSATVTIADNDPNNKPVFNYGETTTPWHSNNLKVSDSSTFTYTFPDNTFTDPDPGDKLTYTATLMDGSPRPSWLNFDPNTRTLSGTSPIAQQLTIKLTATDRAGLSVSDDDPYNNGWDKGMLLTFSSTGVVIDGYIEGATLFLDANKNGILDANEPSTITDTGGQFNLDIPFETFDTNKNGEIDPSEGNLVATGGTDTATGLPLETPVTAPPDSSVVTLLTSLVADLTDKGIAPEEAQSLVKAALSLPAEVDLTSLDPILATNNNQPGGVQVLAAMVKVQNFITQTSALIDGASSAASHDLVKAVVSSITAQIQSGTVLNLSNAAALEPIIQQAAAKIQQIDPSFNSQQVSSITSQSATVMATANQRIDAAVSNPTATSIPESVARLQQVALGPTTQDFKEVGTGNKPISQVVADNTGTALDSRIQAVTLPAGIATPVVSGDADLGSNSPNAIIGTNGDDILTGNSANNVLMGMRGNDSLDGGLGNDTLFGGKGSDTMLGSSGDDALFGNRGADILNGDDGNDILYGGKGDDLLNGGLGIDTLTGGMGVDKFLLSTNSGTDTITDFEVGKDLLVLGNGLTFSQLTIAQDSGATLIRLAQTGEILASLGGVSASSISAVNFGLI